MSLFSEEYIIHYMLHIVCTTHHHPQQSREWRRACLPCTCVQTKITCVQTKMKNFHQISYVFDQNWRFFFKSAIFSLWVYRREFNPASFPAHGATSGLFIPTKSGLDPFLISVEYARQIWCPNVQPFLRKFRTERYQVYAINIID